LLYPLLAGGNGSHHSRWEQSELKNSAVIKLLSPPGTSQVGSRSVSAPLVMPLHDSDIPMNVSFTFFNKQTITNLRPPFGGGRWWVRVGIYDVHVTVLLG